ncbi:MAG TPA: alpha/beta fold hydrolase [Chloroflexota bacterium]|nr:alpha/beta fold hydrolase [Chloroflexota bacterium]
MRRAFVTPGDGSRQVHYRRFGNGPPVVVLPAAPDSSLAAAPFSTGLAARGGTVFALDTPGYGESDPLSGADPAMEDFADALASTFDALGLECADVVGSGSGATLAAAFAVRHHRRVQSLVLQEPVTSQPEQRAWMQSNYTPSLAPEWDGSHLLRAWMIRHDMHVFRPWFVRTPAARLSASLPEPDELHREFVDLLRAGERWGDADQAALRFDLPAALANVHVPIRERFAESEAHPSMRAADTAHRSGRAADTRAHGHTHGVRAGLASTRAGFTREYVDVSFGQVHVRRAGPNGVPLLMLHASPSSSRTLLPLAEMLSQHRPVVAIDTPGFGESDALAATDPGIGEFADAVLEVIHALGVGPLDVYGSHTGALIALEAAVRGPERVRRVVVDGLPVFSPQEKADHLAHYIPVFEPRSDGSHVVWGWNFIRNMILFYPWYQQDPAHATSRAPSTSMLHERVVDVMKAGAHYALGYGAAYRYSTRAALAELTVPAMLCVAHDDVLAHHAAAVRQQRPDLAVTWLDPADRLGATRSAIQAFLSAEGAND